MAETVTRTTDAAQSGRQGGDTLKPSPGVGTRDWRPDICMLGGRRESPADSSALLSMVARTGESKDSAGSHAMSVRQPVRAAALLRQSGGTEKQYG